MAEIVEPEPRWDAALRLLGGVHYLVLTGRASWDRLGDVLVDERDFLRRFAVEQRVQTNEIQRCWALLPCVLDASRRLGVSTLDLVELGTRAGLLLGLPRLRYRYREGAWGPERAPLQLSGDERGPVPASLLREAPRVRNRVGIDRYPVDVTTDEGSLLLQSFVWADRLDRLERLRRAVEVHRQDPLAYVFGGRPEPRSDLYWGLWLTLWPGGTREQIALADFHGAWLDWW